MISMKRVSMERRVTRVHSALERIGRSFACVTICVEVGKIFHLLRSGPPFLLIATCDQMAIGIIDIDFTKLNSPTHLSKYSSKLPTLPPSAELQ
jgi:hypothetical protein